MKENKKRNADIEEKREFILKQMTKENDERKIEMVFQLLKRL